MKYVDEMKQVTSLLTAIGGETYTLLCNLLAPTKPSETLSHN